MTRPPVWVSLEGVNGVGKTHFARRLTDRLALIGADARLVSELTDAGSDAVIAGVIAALSRGRSFLRTGHPLTETLALLSLKVREYEQVLGLHAPPAVVVEDRGVDTVAAYQAAVIVAEGPPAGAADEVRLCALAEQVYDTANSWRPPPDLTLLLVDDPDRCAHRFADREGRDLTADERRLIDQAAQVYAWRAGLEPHRFRTVDLAAAAEPLAVMEHLILDTMEHRR